MSIAQQFSFIKSQRQASIFTAAIIIMIITVLNCSSRSLAGSRESKGMYRVQFHNQEQSLNYFVNFEVDDVDVLIPDHVEKPLVINYSIPSDLTGGAELHVHLKSWPWSFVKMVKSSSFPMNGPIGVRKCSWDPSAAKQRFCGRDMLDNINSGESMASARCQILDNDEISCMVQYPAFDEMVQNSDQVFYLEEKYGKNSPVTKLLMPLAAQFIHEPIGWLTITKRQ